MLRAFSDILSNSSIQQTPLSLSTSAPLSKTLAKKEPQLVKNTFIIKFYEGRRKKTDVEMPHTVSPVSGSFVTYAVKPTAELPLPLV